MIFFREDSGQCVGELCTPGLFEVPAAWCLNSTSHATIEP